MTEQSDVLCAASLPNWVPEPVRRYLAHVEKGETIREIARQQGCHPSTILRQVRRTEERREDLLVDLALRRLGQPDTALTSTVLTNEEKGIMTKHDHQLSNSTPSDREFDREAARVLGRLNEPGASLAIARDMEKAVVVRDGADGEAVRTAVVDRSVAEAIALKDWIAKTADGRITRYKISNPGRMALKRMLAEEEAMRVGLGEGTDPCSEQHRDWVKRNASNSTNRKRGIRYNAAESPLSYLARRRDKNGKPFLDSDLVAAGERLREDFELAQMGPRVAQNWDRFLTAGARGDFASGSAEGGSSAARDRVAKALKDLGPGLGDVVLRCCCFLEGMEAVEETMGWSARSGKIVLRIALMRLKAHYETDTSWSPMIG